MRVLLLREGAETEDAVSPDATTRGDFRSWSMEMGYLQGKYPVIEPVSNTKVVSREKSEGGGLTLPPLWPGV
jgi:hypothetical protein